MLLPPHQLCLLLQHNLPGRERFSIIIDDVTVDAEGLCQDRNNYLMVRTQR